MAKNKLRFDSCRDALMDSLSEQLIRHDEGMLDIDGLREELAFLSEHYQASIWLVKERVGGFLYCEGVRLGTTPTVTIIEAGAA